VLRLFSRLFLILAIACSGKATSPPEAYSTDLRAAQIPAAVALDPPAAPRDPREAALSEAVARLLSREHLLGKPIDDALSRAAFATYMDRLDANKLFLLKSDREALAKYADKIDDELKSGSLELAHEGERVFTTRVAVVEKEVAELLATPLDHDDEEFAQTDPKKLEPAITEQDLRERWRQRLELDVLERVAQMETRAEADKTAKPDPKAGSAAAPPPASKLPATFAERESKARADLAKSYAARFARLRHPGDLDAASELINAVTTSLDPHTAYLPPADKANFDIHMSGSLEGIGASLREHDDYIEVVELVPGGAAWRQGKLGPGDLILAVSADGGEPVEVIDTRIDDVVKMIRGPAGTVVTLRVQKPSGAQETLSITRDVVVVEETYARGAVLTRKGHPALGYIHLPSFYGGRGRGARSAAADVKKLLDELQAKQVAGVILDIRGNTGGLLGDAVEMTGELIDRGPVVQVQDSHGHREVFGDDDRGTDFSGPVIVLVDRFSASASEILAGALQDYHRAVIVGTGPTHGKGTVQRLADLDGLTGGKLDLGVLKLTIQQFFRVSGASTQRQGVTPEIVLPDPEGYLDTGERKLDHAIAWSQIPAVAHDDWPVHYKTTTLAENSARRVAKQPVFNKLDSLMKVMKARQRDTRVPLAHVAFDARRKELRTAVDAAAIDAKIAPVRFNVVSLDDGTPAVAPPPGGKADDRLARWRDNLSRDPWVDECMNILGDMAH
jgi:carboxyl-terminal processing protease